MLAIMKNGVLFQETSQTTAIPAKHGVGIDFSVPSAFLAQVTPKSIPTPLLGAINGNYCSNNPLYI